MERLLVRFAPRASESLLGYVLRLTEANGYAGPGAIRRVAGLPAPFAARPCDLSGLATAVGNQTDLTTLERLAAWPDAAGLVRLGATRLHPALVSFSRPRVCVRCVEEGQEIEPAWDVIGCAACPRHGTVLTDACACGRPLGWDRPGLARCRCWRTLDVSARDAPSSVIEVAGTVIALSKGERGLHDRLPLTSLDAFAHVVRFLGCEGATSVEWRSHLMAKPTVEGSLAAAGRAAPVLANWPQGWRDWLLAPGRFGGEAATGADRLILHRRLRVLLSKPGLERMLDEARRAIMEGPHGPLVKASDFLHTDCAHATFVRGILAARRLGVCTTTVATLIARREIGGESRVAGRRRMHVLPLGSVDAALGERTSAYSAGEAARRLAITPRQLSTLRRAGLITARCGLPGIRGERRYGPAAIDDLIARIAARAAVGPRPGDISLRAVAERRYARFADVICAVLDRRLPVRTSAAGVKDLGDIHIAEQTVLRLRYRQSEECLDVRDAAARLGFSVRMIPVLVRAGCLEAKTAPDGMLGRCSVTERSVVAFPRRYAPASAYAATWGTNTRNAIARLRTAGVKAVVEADTARGISSVWRRVPSSEIAMPNNRRRSCTTHRLPVARRLGRPPDERAVRTVRAS